MAKTQTFGDKMKKKKGEQAINVKVIKAYRTEENNMRFIERYVKISDMNEIDKIDINK